MATTLGGVEIPGVQVQEVSRRVIGGQIVRAVDGTPHVNSVKVIRTWMLETHVLPYADLLALEQVYNNAHGGAVAFHLDEWDGGFVYVHIVEFSDSRSRIPDEDAGGTRTLHSLRIVLEEA